MDELWPNIMVRVSNIQSCSKLGTRCSPFRRIAKITIWRSLGEKPVGA